MKTTKTILTLAVIAALPFGAMADYTYVQQNTPAMVEPGAVATKSRDVAPYVIMAPTTADESHIATTAYVKGAYNDAIAAVNTLDFQIKTKQDQLYTSDVDDANLEVDLLPAQYFVEQMADGAEADELGVFMLSAYGVALGIQSQQVKIYTTWDDDSDSATTHVLLDTILPDDD